MLSEWRENIWLLVELAVVSIVIWGIVVMLYGGTYGLRQPRGFDPENVYTAKLREVPEDSPYRVKGEKENPTNGLREILKNLNDNVYVESAGVISNIPYSFNFFGCSIMPADVVDTVYYFANQREVTPEIVDVLKIKSLTGVSSAHLKEMLADGKVLISNSRQYESFGRNPMDLKGKRLLINNDSSAIKIVGDVIENVRRNDYEMLDYGTLLVPYKENDMWGDVLIRIKPGADRSFIEAFKSKPELRGNGNAYLTELKPLSAKRENAHKEMDSQVKTMVVIMLFMLVTIFLGLLGSFWFRMQQRVGEIAIRKVCGASNRDIFRRVISEGMILLTGAVALISACVWPFQSYIVEYLAEQSPVADWQTLLMGEFAAVALVALGIVLSLWYPARRAMSIEPAVAIKTE